MTCHGNQEKCNEIASSHQTSSTCAAWWLHSLHCIAHDSVMRLIIAAHLLEAQLLICLADAGEETERR